MTYENCLKYMNEAKTEEERLFWKARLERKYPDKKVLEVVKESEPVEAPKKETKKHGK
jgi:hypothetical protein